MKMNKNIRVVFRNANDNLASMFTQVYKTVSAAKTAIETDAWFFLQAHSNGDKKQIAKWTDIESTDHYHARGKDGAACYWQYFTEG